MSYTDAQQRIEYRRQAREFGCICSDKLGPHVHLTTCPLYADTLEREEQRAEERYWEGERDEAGPNPG